MSLIYASSDSFDKCHLATHTHKFALQLHWLLPKHWYSIHFSFYAVAWNLYQTSFLLVLWFTAFLVFVASFVCHYFFLIFDFFVNNSCHFVSYFRVSTTPGNLLEFENPLGNPGNLLEFKWSFWKFLCNDRKLMMWHCLCIEECNIKMLLML